MRIKYLIVRSISQGEKRVVAERLDPGLIPWLLRGLAPQTP